VATVLERPYRNYLPIDNVDVAIDSESTIHLGAIVHDTLMYTRFREVGEPLHWRVLGPEYASECRIVSSPSQPLILCREGGNILMFRPYGPRPERADTLLSVPPGVHIDGFDALWSKQGVLHVAANVLPARTDFAEVEGWPPGLYAVSAAPGDRHSVVRIVKWGPINHMTRPVLNECNGAVVVVGIGPSRALVLATYDSVNHSWRSQVDRPRVLGVSGRAASLGGAVAYHSGVVPGFLLASDHLYAVSWKSKGLAEQLVDGPSVTARDGNQYQVASAGVGRHEIVSWIDDRANNTARAILRSLLDDEGWTTNFVCVGSLSDRMGGIATTHAYQLSSTAGSASCVRVAANHQQTVVAWIGFDSVGFDPRDTNQPERVYCAQLETASLLP
jgi:hypothetical protein